MTGSNVISDKKNSGGKPADVENASVDTHVPPQGKLGIWLMGLQRTVLYWDITSPPTIRALR